MKTFRELFDTILSADDKQSRLAARKVRKFLYGSHGGQYKEIASIIENAPNEYAKITENFRQENFVIAVPRSFQNTETDKTIL